MATRISVFSVMTTFSLSLRSSSGLLHRIVWAPMDQPFSRDQFVEPLDFALAGLQPELVQLPGVSVNRAAGPRHCFTQALTTLLHLTATPLENPHPGLCRSAVEKREVDAESVIGEVLRAGIGRQFGEALLTGIGE